MSIEVELNDDDYKTIANWYEMCFGKIFGDLNTTTSTARFPLTPKDIQVMQKVMVMGLQYADDVRMINRKDSQ